jgi:capsular exopolysaccharide synthesis family protein
VIVDADLRNPDQHTLFGVENAAGIADLLSGQADDWAALARPTPVAELRVLTSGPLPSNAADVLGSRRFAEVLARIAADVDAVLIDTPSLLGVSDALEVAAHADGVVLVMRPGTTKRDRLEAAAMALHNGGMRLLGVVANRVRKATIGQVGSMWRPTEQDEILPIESPEYLGLREKELEYDKEFMGRLTMNDRRNPLKGKTLGGFREHGGEEKPQCGFDVLSVDAVVLLVCDPASVIDRTI